MYFDPKGGSMKLVNFEMFPNLYLSELVSFIVSDK